MKYFIFALALLSTQAFAQTDKEIEIVDSPTETPKVKISEIKKYLSEVDPESTCLDEYLARRKQLILKTAFSPVILAGGAIAGAYSGGLIGAGIASAKTLDGWGGLAYFATGAVAGAGVGVLATGVDTTLSAIALYETDLILKAVAEQKLDRIGEKSEKLYKKYVKHTSVPLPPEIFYDALMTSDENGSLCDGSLIEQPRFKLGFKLKYKVARVKHLSKLQ